MARQQMEMTDRVSAKTTKIDRYKWVVKDTPGTFMEISKLDLRINHEYQRNLLQDKVAKMSASWSWVACGVIIVAYRNGEWWVIDGQHRVMASLRRSDITSLPCLVFQTEDVSDEAKGFLTINNLRKPMTSPDRLKASAVAGDHAAKQLTALCDRLGLRITPNGNYPGTFKAAEWGMRRMAEDPTATTIVMELANELCIAAHEAIGQQLLGGLWYIHKNCEVDLTDTRLRQRIKMRGAKALVTEAKNASAYYSRGGDKVWASGMMNSINKGLRMRFKMRGDNEIE